MNIDNIGDPNKKDLRSMAEIEKSKMSSSELAFMLNKDQKPQECDASKEQQSGEAGSQKDSTPNTQADEDVIREHLISFLMDIDECYAMHIRENAERCVDEYLANNSQPTPKEEDVEKMALDFYRTANKIEITFSLGWMKIFEAGYNAAKTTK
jgi:hypothetical protein